MIFIGIGSNLGERWQNLSQAWQRLEAANIRVIASSPVYETAPWGEPDQPPYLNAVWAVEGPSLRKRFWFSSKLLRWLWAGRHACGAAGGPVRWIWIYWPTEPRRGKRPPLPCLIRGFPIEPSCWSVE